MMRELPPKAIPDIIKEHREEREKQCKHQYRSRLFERQIPSSIQKKRKREPTPVKYLSTDLDPIQENSSETDTSTKSKDNTSE